ncbi:unnamed protein product [Allacma fusca]|uniref:Uncharacterized protein n=1 Tax=Allacma fusca TaxID=39272 RepID=A0A8J2KI15_9HEXA|nr:unnamed protein product [Allacma fusca]
MEINSDVENILLMSSSNESMEDAKELLPLFPSRAQIIGAESQVQEQNPTNHTTTNNKYEPEIPECDMTRMDCSNFMEMQSNGAFTPLESCGYVSYPGGNRIPERDESNFQRTLTTVKPLPSYQIPVFACPNSSAPLAPSRAPQLNLKSVFAWPNSIPSNGIQATLNFPQPESQEKLSDSISSRKRKYEDETDSCSNDYYSSDDGYDCDCEDCRVFLQEDSNMSDDTEEANYGRNDGKDCSSCCSHLHRKCSLPFKSRHFPGRNRLPEKKCELRKSLSCSSLGPVGSLPAPLSTHNAFPTIKSSSRKQGDSYDRETSGNEDTDATDSDNGNDYESQPSDVESPDMSSRGTSPQNNSNALSRNPFEVHDFNHPLIKNRSGDCENENQDTNNVQLSHNQATGIPLSPCRPKLSNHLTTSFSLDHSIPLPCISLTEETEPGLNLRMDTRPHAAPTPVSLPNNKDTLMSTLNSPGAQGDNPSTQSHVPLPKEEFSAELQDSLDEQILQALRAALGIPDDVELEEYEPVDDDDENDNADDEEDDTLDVTVSPEEPQDPRGCLALVEDLVLSYGKISSANEKIKACIEGDVCRVVIGGFLVSASHITRDKGRAGYSLGFYLDDLEINSFMLQVQDGIFRVNGTRDKVDIYLRIEIGAPVRIEDVNVNHNKATNVVWVEVFF